MLYIYDYRFIFSGMKIYIVKDIYCNSSIKKTFFILNCCYFFSEAAFLLFCITTKLQQKEEGRNSWYQQKCKQPSKFFIKEKHYRSFTANAGNISYVSVFVNLKNIFIDMWTLFLLIKNNLHYCKWYNLFYT